MAHLFGDLYAEALYSGDQWRFTAGVQHPLLDRTLVTRHGVNKHCNYNMGNACQPPEEVNKFIINFFLTSNIKSKFLPIPKCM